MIILDIYKNYVSDHIYNYISVSTGHLNIYIKLIITINLKFTG